MTEAVNHKEENQCQLYVQGKSSGWIACMINCNCMSWQMDAYHGHVSGTFGIVVICVSQPQW